MIRRCLLVILFAPIASLWVSLSYATEIIPSTLEYMTGFSDAIIIGYVNDKYSYWENGKIYTNISIDVEKFVKNPQGETSSSIEVKIPGGKVGDIGFEVDQAPVFRNVLILTIVRECRSTFSKILLGEYCNPDGKRRHGLTSVAGYNLL